MEQAELGGPGVEGLYTIRSAQEHRRLLLDSMVRLVEGKMNVQQANALASLSGEVHKSIRLEWDMVTYAAEHFTVGPGGRVRLLESGEEEA